MSVFTQISEKYNWKIKGDPAVLSGGFMHKMFRVDTEQGIFAIKLLNPFVMQRESALKNFLRAESLELLLEENEIPVIGARSFGGRKLQEINGQYFYVFDYYPGKVLKGEEVTDYHCREMGKVLAKIHGIDKKTASQSFPEREIDWEFYLSKLKRADSELYAELNGAVEIIESMQQNGNRAVRKLPPVAAVCHNDMDRKNVLWSGENFRIIDLECLDYGNPFMELFELALCWSGIESGRIDFDLFRSFLKGYESGGGEIPKDPEILYDSNIGRLEWLEYNIKRVLGIDCGEDEREMGLRQARETICLLVYYSEMKEQILRNFIL